MSSSTTLDSPTLPVATVPPDGTNDGGGGDGGGGNWRQNDSGPPISLPRIALIFIIAGVVMLFAAFMTGYVVLRFSAQEWQAEGAPGLPSALWISTIIIFLSSIPAQLAVRAARAGNQGRLKGMVALTLAIGIGFCLQQSALWSNLVADGLTIRSSQLGTNFYCLTILHVVHVLGGVAYLLVTLRDALQGRFNAADHERVANCMIYWHFVGILWYALFTALYLI